MLFSTIYLCDKITASISDLARYVP